MQTYKNIITSVYLLWQNLEALNVKTLKFEMLRWKSQFYRKDYINFFKKQQ